MDPTILIFGGCNGSGKSTAARRFLEKLGGSLPFVNADDVARAIAPHDPENAAVAAGRIVLKEIDEFAQARVSFAFETTLSGKGYARSIRAWRAVGYRIALYYFWLPTADRAVERVRLRVERGGHSIPEETIRSRHVRSARNLTALYMPAVDHWEVYENSEESRMIACGGAGMPESLVDAVAWQQLLEVARP